MSKPTLKTFIVESKNGKPTFTSEEQRKLFFHFWKSHEGKKVWMTLDPKLPKRSDRQNRFYFFYLGIIARETGHTVDELHLAFKQRFLGRGKRNILGEEINAIESTTALSKASFADYLNEIEILTGVPLPDSSIFDLAPFKDG